MGECTFNRSCLNNYCWYSTGGHSAWLTNLLWAWHWLWCRWARGRVPARNSYQRLHVENERLREALRPFKTNNAGWGMSAEEAAQRAANVLWAVAEGKPHGEDLKKVAGWLHLLADACHSAALETGQET